MVLCLPQILSNQEHHRRLSTLNPHGKALCATCKWKEGMNCLNGTAARHGFKIPLHLDRNEQHQRVPVQPHPTNMQVFLHKLFRRGSNHYRANQCCVANQRFPTPSLLSAYIVVCFRWYFLPRGLIIVWWLQAIHLGLWFCFWQILAWPCLPQALSDMLQEDGLTYLMKMVPVWHTCKRKVHYRRWFLFDVLDDWRYQRRENTRNAGVGHRLELLETGSGIYLVP